MASVYFVPTSESVFQLGFEFGPYVETLVRNGVFASCLGDACNKASRMPIIPLFYSALAAISTSALFVAIAKDLIISLIFLVSFYFLLNSQRNFHRYAVVIWCIVGAVLCVSAPVVKHTGAVTYEEGILIEIIALWAYSLLLAVVSVSQKVLTARKILIFNVALAFFAFMTKSSMLLLFIVSVCFCGWHAVRYRSVTAVSVIFVCIMLVVVWGVRNEIATGRFSVMTSSDGENLFRGWNEESLQIYPDVVLDQIFISDVVYLQDGTEIAISQKPTFKGEWVSNDYFRYAAVSWGLSHPKEGAQFIVRKLRVFFIGIVKTPYTYTNDARSIGRGFDAEGVLTSVWLVCGRAFELALMVLVVLLWREGDRGARALAVTAIVATSAYAAPYVVGFAYERHITGYLVLVATCIAVLFSEFLGRLRARSRKAIELGCELGPAGLRYSASRF
jgi:hypothetical protein